MRTYVNWYQPSEHLLGELKIAFAILKKYADDEKFYSFFYGKIVINAGTLIPDLPPPMCTLMAKKLGDNVLHYFKKQKQLPCQKPHSPISAKEMDGLQYLAGYVVSRFLKRIKNSPNYMSESSQSLLSVLNNFVEENNTSQRLIASQTRGGLIAVKNEVQKIFLCAEKTFRAHTSTQNIARKIALQPMVDHLLFDTEVISMYKLPYRKCHFTNRLRGKKQFFGKHEVVPSCQVIFFCKRCCKKPLICFKKGENKSFAERH